MGKIRLCIPMLLTMSVMAAASGSLHSMEMNVGLPSLSTFVILMAGMTFFRLVPERKS